MITKFDKRIHLKDLTQMRLIKQVLVISLRLDHVRNYIIISPLPECLWSPNMARW